MTAQTFDDLDTHEKLKALNAQQLAIMEQVRRIAERIDRKIQAERRALAAHAATFASNISDDHPKS